MSVPEELKKEMMAEFEEHLEKAKTCSLEPGSLEKIMIEAAEKMARITQETLAKAASAEADFSPSTMSALRKEKDVSPETEKQNGGDNVG